MQTEAVEALAAAFPRKPGQFHQVTAHGQPETHWEGSAHASCSVGWCEDCEPVCPLGCCHCECECHDRK